MRHGHPAAHILDRVLSQTHPKGSGKPLCNRT
jgi:hypothetical protein